MLNADLQPMLCRTPDADPHNLRLRLLGPDTSPDEILHLTFSNS